MDTMSDGEFGFRCQAAVVDAALIDGHIGESATELEQSRAAVVDAALIDGHLPLLWS